MLREAETPLSFFEPVAHAPDGENELRGIRVVFDFLTQPAHMNVYGARVDHSIITPHAHQQAVSREDHPAVANEVHEQIKEKRGVEINRLITPAHRSPGDIDAQIINHEHLLLLLVNLSLRRRFYQLLLACPQQGTRTNAQKRSHPCVQLLPIRRLEHVIINPGLEAIYLKNRALLLQEEQYGHAGSLIARTQLMVDVKPVWLRERQIEENERERIMLCDCQGRRHIQ